MTFRVSIALLSLGVVATGTALAVSPEALAAAKAPTVSSLSTTSGPITGGARITVTGTNFARGATVNFGAAAGKSVVVSSPTKLNVIVPAHSAGTVDVRVRTAAGTSALRAADHYRYAPAPSVTSVAPNAGSPNGGAMVTVRGANFTTATGVSFGTTKATGVHYVSTTQLTATAPTHAAGIVDLVATNGYGRSTLRTADQFTYREAPEAVVSLRAVDLTATTATLRWTASPSSDVTGVIVRRADGISAPSSPTAGQAVATVPSGTSVVLDPSLTKDTTYTYALFAYTSVGPLYSAASTITVATPHNSRPDLPTGLTTNPASPGSATGCTTTPYCVIPTPGGRPLVLAAQVSDPDGDADRLTAQFRLWDATDGSRTYLVDGEDPEGRSSSVPGSGGITIVQIDAARLTDGHLYGMDVVASDGEATSATAGPYFFRLDATAPGSLTVTSPDASFHVNATAHFHLTASEIAPQEGQASGFDHFAYSFGSPASLTGDGGTHLAGTVIGLDASADFTTTPTTWGTNYLYVTAVDRAGNHSQTAAYSFYVVG